MKLTRTGSEEGKLADRGVHIPDEALKFGIVDKVFAHRPKDEETGVESGSGGAPEA